jgi:hypothetical protein
MKGQRNEGAGGTGQVGLWLDLGGNVPCLSWERTLAYTDERDLLSRSSAPGEMGSSSSRGVTHAHSPPACGFEPRFRGTASSKNVT